MVRQERKGDHRSCRSLVRPEARQGVVSIGQAELGVDGGWREPSTTGSSCMFSKHPLRLSSRQALGTGTT